MRVLAVLAIGLAAACGSSRPRPAVEPAPAPATAAPDATPRVAAPDATPAIAAPEATPHVVTLHAVGDITLGGDFEPWLDQQLARGRFDATQALAYGMDKMRAALAAADVTVANLEGTFAVKSPLATGGFAFKARPALAGILVDGGIDVVALGNNHMMDYGPGGVVETLAALDAVGVGWSGAGRDVAEAHRPWLTEVRGVRLGFLSYKVTGRHDVDQPPTGTVFHADGATVAWCHFDWHCILDLVTSDIDRLAPTVDVVVVSFHWGQEKHYHPDPYQVALAHAAVDHGARVVFGSHPHVLQGVELYGDAVIYYSLGNYLFGGNDAPFDPIGGMASVTVSADGRVLAADLLPVRTTSDAAPFQPVALEGAEASRVLAAVGERSRAFARTLPSLTRAPDLGGAR
ncbi:MAG: CapA family protein [Myxococcota bacterium]